jgi:predicted TIM-barrel fold metal-dependent hydrolase
MDDLPIIDAHHHLYDLEHYRYPWLQDGVQPIVFGDYSSICKSYLIEHFLEDAKDHNVVKSVHIDVGYDRTDAVGETRWLQSVADKHGYPHGIVGYADLGAPGVQAVLEGHCRYKNIRGIRHSLNYHPDPVKTYLDRPGITGETKWREGFKLLRGLNLSFDLQIYFSQAEESYQLAKAFPDTQIILDHTLMPVDRSPEDIAGWRSGIRLLAEAPNIACKISGLGMGDWKWTTDSIRPFVLTAIEAFGTDRCMFASNFPVDKLFSSYDTLFKAYKEITKGFSPTERRKLFHDNAERFYRL